MAVRSPWAPAQRTEVLERQRGREILERLDSHPEVLTEKAVAVRGGLGTEHGGQQRR